MYTSVRDVVFLVIQPFPLRNAAPWRKQEVRRRYQGQIFQAALIQAGAKIVDLMSRWLAFAFPTLANFSFKVGILSSHPELHK